MTLNLLDEIGEYFGEIRPSAVSLGSRRIKERIKTDKNFKKLVRQLESDVIASYNYNEYQTSKMCDPYSPTKLLKVIFGPTTQNYFILFYLQSIQHIY